MKVAQKPRGTARFRRYERASVCGIWQWKCHFGPLSPAAIFGVSFFTYRAGKPTAEPKAIHSWKAVAKPTVDNPLLLKLDVFHKTPTMNPSRLRAAERRAVMDKY